MSKHPKRGDVYWTNLDPTIGSEINKRRPCVVVSNDAGNEVSHRVIVAPITSSVRKVFPFEVQVEVQGRSCKVLLDQIRSIDKQRLSKKISSFDRETVIFIDKALKIALGLS